MPIYDERIESFRKQVADQADLAFCGVSADLTYLTGVPRPQPNYGAVLHPGAWAEGLWLPAQGEARLILSRMSAEFSGLTGSAELELHVLEDAEDPSALVQEILPSASGAPDPRILLNDGAHAETVIELQRLWPVASFGSTTEVLRVQRRVKDESELAAMATAGEMTERAFRGVLDKLRQGMSEAEVISEVELQLRQQGSPGSSFAVTLYCSGPDHPLIFGRPQQTGPRPLQPPVAVLFDFGAINQGYCYDFGRTVFFGEPNEEMRTIHRLVMESQAAGIEALTEGATAAQVDGAARAVIRQAGYAEAFRHRLGHGIGLDVHEPPFLTESDKTVLEQDMLFTIEPSITQFEGYSARVEDVVAVGAREGRPLTAGYQDLIVVD